MDVINIELDGINERIVRLEARRDAPGVSDAMYVLHTNEIIALRNQAAALINQAAAIATRAAAQFPAWGNIIAPWFPAGVMNFSQRSYLTIMNW